MNWHRKTWQPPVVPRRLSVTDFQRPTVDGLALAVDIQSPSLGLVGRPMNGTLVHLSMSVLEPWEYAGFHRTLESILLLPERAR